MLIFVKAGTAQSACPTNIGFESGDFTNWKCYAGSIQAATGVIKFTSPTPPFPGRHTIFQNTYPQQRDYFGDFPVNCPNGSGYSIRLGNSSVGAEADRVSYTFTVPLNKNEYSIIYNYAIVFQDPGHLPYEQPKFTSKVYDETAGEYLSCGAFEYVASSGLPGFKASDVGTSVYYKDWTPVTIKLMNCAGKTITIEFTVNDCSRGGHFGYAYLDINENCTSPITGNIYCNGATSITLTAPFGFKEYHWLTSDFASVLGTQHTLHLDPIPPVGTVIALEIVPYPDLGCLDTLYTTIQLSAEAFTFKLSDTAVGCEGSTIDLTNSQLTQGSTGNLSFSYFIDSSALQYLPTPAHVTEQGRYYIKAVNTTGCTETQDIDVLFHNVGLKVKDPPIGCYPASLNLTQQSIIAGSSPGLNYSYWLNELATQPVTDPTKIETAGTYYIKAADGFCTEIEPVKIDFLLPSSVVTQPVANCKNVDLTSDDITTGSAAGFTFTQWLNDAATVPLPDPKNVTSSGTYYIKGTSTTGCSFIKPVDVTVKPIPDFTISNPPPVTAPYTVNITNLAVANHIFSYSFWEDDKATQKLITPYSISKSGTYYVKAVDSAECYSIKPVFVSVIVPYNPLIKYPNVFSPNKDGINDGFRIDIGGNITFNFLKIYDRWGQLVFSSTNPFEYWYGEKNAKPVAVGTYYWVLEFSNNNNNEFFRRSGSITLLR